MPNHVNRRHRLLWRTAGPIALILVGVIYLTASREPTYQGRSVTSWLKTYHQAAAQPGPFGSGTANSNLAALRALGPKAVPYLIRGLEKKDSIFAKLYWRLWLKIPTRYQTKVPPPPLPAFQWRLNAAAALSGMGPDAQPAIPALIQALKTPDWSSQSQFLITLNSLHADTPELKRTLLELPISSANLQMFLNNFSGIRNGRTFEPQIVLPIFMSALKDADAEVRAAAVRGIEFLGPPAKETVPDLIACIADKDREVRYLAVRTLRQFGADATSAIPALKQAFVDENFLVRSAATNTLRKLELPSNDRD